MGAEALVVKSCLRDRAPAVPMNYTLASAPG
jgi:hypothetical protein